MLVRMDHRLQTARSLGLDYVAAEVCAALGAAQIQVVLLKGPALATWLYDDGTVRPYGDVDLLVAPDDHPRAERVLSALGFVRILPGRSAREEVAYARGWTRGGTHVDLHRALWGVGIEPARAWPMLLAGTESLAVGGGNVTVLGPPARALHVALHAAQHGPHHPKPAQDLARALARLPFETWQLAAALAGRLGAAEAMAVGLRLESAGAGLASRLGLPVRAPLVVSVSAASVPRGTKALATLLGTPGLGARAAQVARLMVPSRAQVRATVPFARRTRAGMVVGYVWLALGRVWRLPRAAAGVARVSLANRR